MGLHAGLEILRIDGIDVHEYATREVRPYESASTPQDLDVRVYRFGLLQGDAERSIRLRVSDASGRQQTLSLARTGYGADDEPEPPPGLFSTRDVGAGLGTE